MANKISLALLGKNIAHSKSKMMYEDIFQRSIFYQHFDYESESEIPALENLFHNIQGLSITAPYKKVFLNNVILADEIKPLHAINCIKKVQDQFYATNTDYEAIAQIFELNNFKEREIILLGSGSMAHVTKCFLKLENITFKQLSRKIDGPLEKIDLKILSETSNPLIINSCAREFIFSGTLPKQSVFWDFNYAHSAHADQIPKLCEYYDGLEMLKLQAVRAVDFWGLK